MAGKLCYIWHVFLYQKLLNRNELLIKNKFPFIVIYHTIFSKQILCPRVQTICDILKLNNVNNGRQIRIHELPDFKKPSVKLYSCTTVYGEVWWLTSMNLYCDWLLLSVKQILIYKMCVNWLFYTTWTFLCLYCTVTSFQGIKLSLKHFEIYWE